MTDDEDGDDDDDDDEVAARHKNASSVAARHKSASSVAARQAEVGRGYLKREARIDQRSPVGLQRAHDHRAQEVQRGRVSVFAMGAFAEMPGGRELHL